MKPHIIKIKKDKAKEMNELANDFFKREYIKFSKLIENAALNGLTSMTIQGITFSKEEVEPLLKLFEEECFKTNLVDLGQNGLLVQINWE